jgi:hypothetical protein
MKTKKHLSSQSAQTYQSYILPQHKTLQQLIHPEAGL